MLNLKLTIKEDDVLQIFHKVKQLKHVIYVKYKQLSSSEIEWKLHQHQYTSLYEIYHATSSKPVLLHYTRGDNLQINNAIWRLINFTMTIEYNVVYTPPCVLTESTEYARSTLYTMLSKSVTAFKYFDYSHTGGNSITFISWIPIRFSLINFQCLYLISLHTPCKLYKIHMKFLKNSTWTSHDIYGWECLYSMEFNSCQMQFFPPYISR